ncbi:hypothetical protein BKA56DRAFT_612290 [Ilyonectria sp. MPI-CAGE-AT-0026]|nr:hypothetical protein BKA56DRAFT_612290 [Ilyonectria sp. MPI-CAGE-AT-0026]
MQREPGWSGGRRWFIQHAHYYTHTHTHTAKNPPNNAVDGPRRRYVWGDFASNNIPPVPGCKDRKQQLRGATGASRKGLGRRRGRHGSRSVWPITLSRTSRCLSPGWLRALQPLKRRGGWGPLADAQRGRAGDGRALRAWVAATASPAGHSRARDGRRNATTLVSSSHCAVRRRAVGHWTQRDYCREHPTALFGTLQLTPSSLQLPSALTSLSAHPPTTGPTAPCPADLQPLCKGSRPRHWALAV